MEFMCFEKSIDLEAHVMKLVGESLVILDMLREIRELLERLKIGADSD